MSNSYPHPVPSCKMRMSPGHVLSFQPLSSAPHQHLLILISSLSSPLLQNNLRLGWLSSSFPFYNSLVRKNTGSGTRPASMGIGEFTLYRCSPIPIDITALAQSAISWLKICASFLVKVCCHLPLQQTYFRTNLATPSNLALKDCSGCNASAPLYPRPSRPPEVPLLARTPILVS